MIEAQSMRRDEDRVKLLYAGQSAFPSVVPQGRCDDDVDEAIKSPPRRNNIIRKLIMKR